MVMQIESTNNVNSSQHVTCIPVGCVCEHPDQLTDITKMVNNCKEDRIGTATVTFSQYQYYLPVPYLTPVLRIPIALAISLCQ